jgi:HSP20 family protein
MGLIPWTPRRMWDPVDWIRQSQEDMNRVFERSLVPISGRSDQGAVFAPALDVVDGEGEVIVRAELPGLEKDQIQVSLVGNTLNIKGEKKTEREDKKQDFCRRECSYGSFERVIQLPDNADTTKTDASFKNGVLEIHVAKQAEAKPKQIDVHVK